jgi:hypothetical protein
MKILKCDVCGRVTEERAYLLPHPEVNDDWEVCKDCYEDFGLMYRKWLESRGKKLVSHPNHWEKRGIEYQNLKWREE